MHGHHHETNGSGIRTLLAVAVLLSVFAMVVPALAQPLAIPATFVRYVTVPGASESILRPSAIHYDRHHDEMLVADFGHNRVVVYAPSGAYKFDFELGENVTAPRDLTTDPAGYIYVLGSLQTGTVLRRFDFDGVAMEAVPLPTQIEGIPLSLRSVACDDDGVLYLLDHDARRILVVDPEQGLRDWFSVGATAEDEEMFGLGRLAVSGDELLVPVSTQGTVLRIRRDGTPLGSVGFFGAKAGTLNFPVAVEAVGEDKILVLDRNRFCVVCFEVSTGRCLGEFGGKGHSPGWFINPTLLAIPSADHVVVGQIFQNKIQVCDLPGFVSGRAREGADEDVDFREASASAAGSTIAQLRRSTRHTYRVPVSTRSEAATSQSTDPLSHLEVSE